MCVSEPQWCFCSPLLGDETTPQTAKSFASREEPDASLRPVLEVTYQLPRLRQGHAVKRDGL